MSFKRKLRQKRSRGVPKGYKHDWDYRGRWKEYKTGPRKWTIDFRATKHTKAKAMGPRPGSKVLWHIDAYQEAIKTKKGTYQTRMRGTKTLVRSRMR